MTIVFLLGSIALPVPAVKGGGIETLLTMLARYNEKFAKYSFIFISPDVTDSKESWDNSVFYRCSTSPNGDPFPYESRVRQILKNVQIDYMIMEGAASRIDGYFRDLVPKQRLGIHIHNHFPRFKVFREAFGVTIAVSDFIANEWRKGMGKEEVDQDIIFVLKNAVDSTDFNKRISNRKRGEIRRECGFDEKDFVVIFCGRLKKEKGIEELIKAILNIECDRVKLLVIGTAFYADGNLDSFSKEIVEKMRVQSNKIYYKGYVNNDELYNYYQSSDVQVIPSLWEEPAGLVAIEGMFSRLPIIYTKSGGMPEFFSEDSGLMIEKDNDVVENIRQAILWVKDNREDAKIMAANAYTTAFRYDAESYYMNFCKIMDNWSAIRDTIR